MSDHEIELDRASPAEIESLADLLSQQVRGGQLLDALHSCWKLSAVAPESTIAERYRYELLSSKEIASITRRENLLNINQAISARQPKTVMIWLSLLSLRDGMQSNLYGFLAQACFELSEHKYAALALLNVINQSSADENVWNALAAILFESGDFVNSCKAFDKVSRLRTDLPSPRVGVAMSLFNLGSHERALDVMKGAIRSFPGDRTLIEQLRIMLIEHHKIKTGLSDEGAGFDIEQLLELVVEESLLREKKDYAAVVENLKQQQKLDPADPFLAVRLSYFQLADGQFEEGFKNYKARLEAEPDLVWKGSDRPRLESRAGETDFVVVFADQGLGEQIMFSPVLHVLEAHDWNYVVVVDARLIPALARKFKGTKFLSPGATLPQHDFWVPLSDLFGMFHKEVLNLDKSVVHPLLPPNPALVEGLRSRHPAGAKIGVSWAGGTRVDKSARSISVEEFVEDAGDGLLLNLQYSSTSSEFVPKTLNNVLDSTINNRSDIESLISLMSLCEAVVSVDNANAHLACAVCVPTMVLVPGNMPIFRWLNPQLRDFLFPTAEVVVQSSLGDWSKELKYAWRKVGRGKDN